MKLFVGIALACACAFAKTTIEPSGNSFIVTTDIPYATQLVSTVTCADGTITAPWSAKFATGQWTSIPNPCVSFSTVEVEIRNVRDEGYGYKSYLFASGEWAEIATFHLPTAPAFLQFVAPIWREYIQLCVMDSSPTLASLNAVIQMTDAFGRVETIKAEPGSDSGPLLVGFQPSLGHIGGNLFVFPKADAGPHKITSVQYFPGVMETGMRIFRKGETVAFVLKSDGNWFYRSDERAASPPQPTCYVGPPMNGVTNLSHCAPNSIVVYRYEEPGAGGGLIDIGVNDTRFRAGCEGNGCEPHPVEMPTTVGGFIR